MLTFLTDWQNVQDQNTRVCRVKIIRISHLIGRLSLSLSLTHIHTLGGKRSNMCYKNKAVVFVDRVPLVPKWTGGSVCLTGS
jgi:hypothetical protein